MHVSKLYFATAASCLAFGWSASSFADEAPAITDQQRTFVQTSVLPLLESRCFECHKHGKEVKGGLLLSSRRAMLKGGESGPAIVPGKPDASLLMEAVRYESFEMPPRTRMPAEEVAIFEKWIADGAPWPADLESEPHITDKDFPLEERRRSHWAWQPIVRKRPPNVTDASWPKDPVDAFLLARLEFAQLTPAPDADRRTLLRRLYFDVVGLPATIDQIEAFVNDPADDDKAIAKIVDELLASPHFGERWGRHWLDLVRYGETLGHEFDYPLHNAWRYRDYVIRAFNADVPYDQFVTEHIAGDLLQQPRRHPTEQYNESIIGTGFWFLNEDKHSPVDVRAEEAAKIDNRIDVFSKTFLGMTVACARCHDHKFDAISTKDYYALAGFLQSSRRRTAWLDPHDATRTRIDELKAIRSEAADSLRRWWSQPESQQQIQRYVLAAVETIHGEPSEAEGGSSTEDPPRKYKRDSAVVAQERDCDPAILQRWIEVLTAPASGSLDHPLSALASLASSSDPKSPVQNLQRWKQMVQAAASDKRTDEVTSLFADFKNGLPAGWFRNGRAFEALPEPRADSDEPQLGWRGNQIVVTDNIGVSSADLSTELRGTLSSPTFELTHPEIRMKVAGEGCRVRVVIDGYQMMEFNALLFGGIEQSIATAGKWQWLRLAGDLHRYQGHRVHIDFLDEGNGWIAVQEVRFANTAGAAPPNPLPDAPNVALANKPAAASIEEAVAQWMETTQQHSRTRLSSLVVANLLDGLITDQIWTTSVEQWTKSAIGLPAPIAVIAMTEGTPENEHVFIRGSHRNLGEVAERNILTALQTGPSILQHGSGRLQLAEQLFHQDNPLIARVAVNRIWHHLFGAGIVESADNFGVLGKPPTHPELLDHLAVHFRDEGWSVKSLIRTLVLSRTYRMSSQRSDDGESKDPTNQLLHRARIKRLQGEAVRDAILLVSGRLDRKQFGSPVPVHLTEFMQGRGRPGQNGPLDGDGRRSIYIAVNRNFLPPFMLAFDVPAPVTTTGKRTTSNVPAQALIMLNNQFVQQQAELWAQRLLSDQQKSTDDLVKQAWYDLFGRPATNDEIQPLLEFLEAAEPASTQQRPSPAQMAEICHVLLNSKEFMFLR